MRRPKQSKPSEWAKWIGWLCSVHDSLSAVSVAPFKRTLKPNESKNTKKERVVNQNCTHDVETVFIVYTLSFILVFLILISIFFRFFLLRTYKITSLYSCFCAWFVRCFEFIPNIKSLHSLFTCFQCFVSCSFWCCVGKTNDRVEKRQCVPNIWGTKKQKQIENAFEWIEGNSSKTIYTIETTWCWIYIRELKRLCE